MIWFTSDIHFYHKNIIRYSSRPFSSIEEMNETIINNWNSVVRPNDIVWNLGDFSFGSKEDTIKILKRLNGEHNLILGNHDKMIESKPNEFIGKNLLNSIQHYKEISFNKQKIVAIHYGMRVWNRSHHGSWCLYGHSHGTLPPFGKSVDVGVDAKFITEDYRPISFDEILNFMNSQAVKVNDHHNKLTP